MEGGDRDMVYVITPPLVTSRLPKLTLELLLRYREKHKAAVKRRLGEFKELKNASDTRLFYELCYCILTPQSNGLVCDMVVADLAGNGVLLDPLNRRSELEMALKKTRFWRTKSKHIIQAWKRFGPDGEAALGSMLKERRKDFGEVRDFRNWLRREMRGMGVGLKETGHFLRNIGYCDGLAIIDRHIMRCLKELGVVEDAPDSIRSERDYLKMESRMIDFSFTSQFPLAELDLLFWSAKTGYIFK